MKRLFTSLALFLSCALAAAKEAAPQNVRVTVQYIALSHRSLTELLAGGAADHAALHDKAFALTKEGKAVMLETGILTCSNQAKALFDSIREEIYPVEYMDGEGLEGSYSYPQGRPFRGGFGQSFETRNTGVTLEIAPAVTPSGRVDLRFVPETVTLVRLDTHMEHTDRWGKADIRMPIFETWRTHTRMSMESGKFALVSSITPKRKLPVPFEDTRVLLFVRVDVLANP